jgi:hypothetical protein
MALTGRGGNPIGSGVEMAKVAQECKPDYQKQAAATKQKLDEAAQFNNELTSYIFSSMPYELKDREFNLFELKGFMEFHITKLQNDYNELLSRIEKEKADGSK